MVQTWILRRDLNPMAAQRLGQDASICGTCVHRSRAAGGHATCYVNVGQAPASIWRSYRAGKLQKIKHYGIFSGRLVRFGAYGDPAAAPLELWAGIASVAAGWTGYSHSWKRFPGLKQYCMASVETPEGLAEAASLGWRTFRILPSGILPAAGEIACPASAEQDNRLQCVDCRACDGISRGARRVSVAIQVHGRSTARQAETVSA
jgi:hypothetical protein